MELKTLAAERFMQLDVYGFPRIRFVGDSVNRG